MSSSSSFPSHMDTYRSTLSWHPTYKPNYHSGNFSAVPPAPSGFSSSYQFSGSGFRDSPMPSSIPLPSYRPAWTEAVMRGPSSSSYSSPTPSFSPGRSLADRITVGGVPSGPSFSSLGTPVLGSTISGFPSAARLPSLSDFSSTPALPSHSPLELGREVSLAGRSCSTGPDVARFVPKDLSLSYSSQAPHFSLQDRVHAFSVPQLRLPPSAFPLCEREVFSSQFTRFGSQSYGFGPKMDQDLSRTPLQTFVENLNRRRQRWEGDQFRPGPALYTPMEKVVRFYAEAASASFPTVFIVDPKIFETFVRAASQMERATGEHRTGSGWKLVTNATTRLCKNLAAELTHELYKTVYVPIAATAALFNPHPSEIWCAVKMRQDQEAIDRFFGTNIAAIRRWQEEAGFSFMEMPMPTASMRSTALKTIEAGRRTVCAYNRAVFEEYKISLRAQMEKPYVSDARLREHIDYIYKPDGIIGNGSTAAAIRHEITTGERVCGKFHSQKGRNMITALEKWLRNNPTAKSADRAAAENIIKDLHNALGE